MLRIRTVTCKLFKYKWPNVLLNNYYASTTQPAIQTTQENYEKQLKDFETLATVTKKVRQKKPQKPPFLKNILVGTFDTDILAYPELEKEDIENLETAVSSIHKLMRQEHMANCKTLSNKNFRQNLYDYKAIGLRTPQLMDGRECYVSEYHRFLETLSFHKLRDNIIYNELGAQFLLEFADDQLKRKYLHRIMNGDDICAFCMHESNITEITSMKTKATLSEDKKSWTLNGEKASVVNGVTADILFVLVLTDIVSKGSIKEPKLSVFVVDGDSPGVSRTKIEANGLEMAYVNFDNTSVPNENVIGQVNKADAILAPLMSEFRLSCGTACVSLTKKILKELALHILNETNDSNLLAKTDFFREKIATLATDLYAMESILYLTTGLIDTYENQDCELESMIVKIFNSRACLNAAVTALDLVGVPAISRSHWANQLHQEAVQYPSFHEANSTLTIMLALLGLQYAGGELNDKVEKIRNPLFHPFYTLKRIWGQDRHIADNPKLDLRLNDYLHPSLCLGAQYLEYCVKRVEFATELLLARYGGEVISQHIELRRLGECLIDIYLMTATLGRASRSYCIGLQHGHLEMMTANIFCSYAMERVKANVLKIYRSDNVFHDETYRAISKQVFKSKEYFFKHPLSRNF